MASPRTAPLDWTRLLPLPGAPESNHGQIYAIAGHPTRVVDPLEQVHSLALDSVASPETRRQYRIALSNFAAYRKARGNPAFERAAVMGWRAELLEQGLMPATVNQRLAAVRKLAAEAAANGYIDHATAAAIKDVPGVRQAGTRMGNWLDRKQAQALIEAPPAGTLMGRRDRCALALLVGCALRRAEAAGVTFDDIQQRDGRWCIVDLRGKRGRIRTVPVPAWVKQAVDAWAEAAGISSGRVLRAFNRGKLRGDSITPGALLDLVRRHGDPQGLDVKAHDLRRTCAKLCRNAGGELEQIQLLLGHASIQTTERYLGTKQDLAHAPNDRLGLKWRDA
jgi:integrase